MNHRTKSSAKTEDSSFLFPDSLFPKKLLAASCFLLLLGKLSASLAKMAHLDLFFFLVCTAIACLAIFVIPRIGLWIGSLFLAISAFLSWQSHDFAIIQLMELAMQGSLLAIIGGYSVNWLSRQQLITGLKLALTLTFWGHGAYALGISQPVPGHFLGMVQTVLGLENEQAYQFLALAGTLDFVAGILIWVPTRWVKTALWYMVVWGLLTALARPVSLWIQIVDLESILVGLSEALYRLPHGLVALALVQLSGSPQKDRQPPEKAAVSTKS
ncbi:MAG: hypothetical protein AAGI38_08515 [Bacteroidota bacterium]